jgi:tRNA threonylcarbamoyladenosine biosynthesis protein TsaB
VKLPRLLLVNTATAAGSVALTAGETLVGEVLLNLSSTHSDRLLPSISQLLTDTGTTLTDLDAIGVVTGPGAFTGLRVGVATVKGLALATGKPTIGVSSLQALAMQVPGTLLPVCALLDARKQEVYAGLYRWQGGLPLPRHPERVTPPDLLLEGLEGTVLFVGDGAVAYRTLIVRRLGPRAHFAPWPCHTLRASSCGPLVLAALAAGETQSAAALAPVYVRPSEAEIRWGESGSEGTLEG